MSANDCASTKKHLEQVFLCKIMQRTDAEQTGWYILLRRIRIRLFTGRTASGAQPEQYSQHTFGKCMSMTKCTMDITTLSLLTSRPRVRFQCFFLFFNMEHTEWVHMVIWYSLVGFVKRAVDVRSRAVEFTSCVMPQECWELEFQWFLGLSL